MRAGAGVFALTLGDATVWVNDRLEQLDLEAELPLVSAQRREAALRYRHESGRRQSVAAYRLLQRALGEGYGIDMAPTLEAGPQGKPSLVEAPHICFNLSHCREAAVCAVSRRPVGVDVECVDRRVDKRLVTHTMNDDECRRIATSDDPAAEFIALWTAKESVLKLHGTGITNDLRDVLTGPESRGVELKCHRAGRYIITVAQYLLTPGKSSRINSI